MFVKLFLAQVFVASLASSNNEKEGYNGTLLEDIKNMPSNELVSLDKIVIKYKNIPIVYKDSITDLHGLKIIQMDKDDILEIQPGAFHNLSNLENIFVSGNNLKEIKEGVFNYLPIVFLDLSKNQISTIESGALDHLPKLEVILLHDNKISVWNNEWLKHSPSIMQISMTDNELEELPAFAFKNVKQNKADSRIINLTFRQNKIKKIHPEAFKGLHHMEWLVFTGNKITEIDCAAFDEINIKRLWLNRNLIDHHVGDLNKLRNTQEIYLEINPIQCDSYVRIKKWGEENNKTVAFSYTKMVECKHTKIEEDY